MIWYLALFSFKGRLNRKGFWQGLGLNFLFLLIWVVGFGNIFSSPWIIYLPLLVSFYSIFAIGVKRLHDRKRLGTNALILFVPVICLGVDSLAKDSVVHFYLGILMPMLVITLLIIDWGCFQGLQEPNHYGNKGLSITFRNETKLSSD